MATEKLVYVPRNWKVSYVDSLGHEHEDVAISANAEYRIVEDGIPYNTTVSGIRNEEDTTYIVAKVFMYPGYMNAMEKVKDRCFDVNKVTEISRISTTYVKAARSREKAASEDIDVFTFAFDTVYSDTPSQRRISVYAGEFVALAVKDPSDPNKKSRSIYGHIVDVDTEKEEIKFSRYVTKRGIRDVYDNTVSLASLLGIYRYELEITDYVEKKKESLEWAPAPEVEETSTEE